MGSFALDTSKFKSVKAMDRKLERAAFATLKRYAPRVERYAKHNAPWTDRTTNARNGLFAKAAKLGDRMAIILAHSADYGIYLEEGTEHASSYAIIRPTIRLYGPKVLATYTKLLDRLG